MTMTFHQTRQQLAGLEEEVSTWFQDATGTMVML
jgi:hypothetical protein